MLVITLKKFIAHYDPIIFRKLFQKIYNKALCHSEDEEAKEREADARVVRKLKKLYHNIQDDRFKADETNLTTEESKELAKIALGIDEAGPAEVEKAITNNFNNKILKELRTILFSTDDDNNILELARSHRLTPEILERIKTQAILRSQPGLLEGFVSIYKFLESQKMLTADRQKFIEKVINVKELAFNLQNSPFWDKATIDAIINCHNQVGLYDELQDKNFKPYSELWAIIIKKPDIVTAIKALKLLTSHEMQDHNAAPSILASTAPLEAAHVYIYLHRGKFFSDERWALFLKNGKYSEVFDALSYLRGHHFSLYYPSDFINETTIDALLQSQEPLKAAKILAKYQSKELSDKTLATLMKHPDMSAMEAALEFYVKDGIISIGYINRTITEEILNALLQHSQPFKLAKLMTRFNWEKFSPDARLSIMLNKDLDDLFDGLFALGDADILTREHKDAVCRQKNACAYGSILTHMYDNKIHREFIPESKNPIDITPDRLRALEMRLKCDRTDATQLQVAMSQMSYGWAMNNTAFDALLNSKVPVALSKAIILLKKHELRQFYEFYLYEHLHPLELAKAFKYLHGSIVLSSKELSKLAKHPEPDELSKAIILIQRMGELTEKHRSELFKHPHPEKYANAVRLEHNDRIFKNAKINTTLNEEVQHKVDSTAMRISAKF